MTIKYRYIEDTNRCFLKQNPCDFDPRRVFSMNFFTHLLLGVAVAAPFIIQFTDHRKLFLFVGSLFGILPDIDYILGGFTINRMYAGFYVDDYKLFISPEIRVKLIDVLND